jgi:glycosyltransferase involved in cell wall biosynthesis
VKLLALSGWFPYPPDQGARMRTHNLLRQLAQEHEIVLLSFAEKDVAEQHVEAVRAYCRAVEIVPSAQYRPHHLKALLGFFSPRPRSVTDTYSPAMARLVQEKLANEPFDAVVASAIGPTGGTAPYVQKIKNVPRIVEDLELSIIKDRIAIQTHWRQRARLSLTWWKLRDFAVKLLRDLDGCTVASPRERDLIWSISPGYRPLEVIPNGLDLALYDGDFGPVEPDTLIFPGALTYKANLWAMQFFLSRVLPIIEARRPGVRLYITGRTEGVALETLALGEGVVLTGYLDDVRPRLAQSAVCVVPMTVGGGTRLKVLEALALGAPVVSTTKGAEGLEVTSWENILLADEPAAFADAVVRLLDDAALRTRLAANGRRLVRERYGWDQIGKGLNRFLHQVVQQFKHRGKV